MGYGLAVLIDPQTVEGLERGRQLDLRVQTTVTETETRRG